MANINFYLKPGNPNKKGEKIIVMRITYNYNRTIVFIGKKIHPKYWNNKKQQVRPANEREQENNYEKINETIRIYRDKAEDAINNAIKKDLTLSDAYFKNWFSNKYANKEHKEFFELFDDYIETNKPNLAPWTIRGYKTVKSFLKSFEDDTKYHIDFNGLDMAFFDMLKHYAFSNKKIQDNYFAKIISVLKSFLTWAKDRGAKIPEHYHKFSAPEKEKEIIFLTLDELMKLFKHDFKNAKLNKARDIYCFGCFTGLRISDIKSLQHEHIKDGFIHKTIKKTTKTQNIPINQFAKQILDKYKNLEDRPLPSISEQKLNEYIKDCCEEIDIDEPINIVKFYGGRTEETTYPKYKLITTHTARKTFLTNSILLGMNQMAARGISGHKRDKNFNRYVKIAEDFQKKEMDRTWGKLSLRKKKK